MPVLWLVRHAQASFGAADYDVLSPVGDQQCRRLGTRLAHQASLRRVVHGRPRRQRDTATQGVLPHVDGDAVVDWGWDEFDEGPLLRILLRPEEQLPPDGATDPGRLRDALDLVVRRWADGQGAGTSLPPFRSFRDGVGAALDRAFAAAHPGRDTVVVTSAGVIAAALLLVQRLPDTAWPELSQVTVNTGITKVVRGRRGTSVVTFNDHAHLEREADLVTYR
jgi:broad specificity phosphatase PhoE